MKGLINRIYELTNSAILTPQNLLDNILLDNYKEIKYRATSNNIVCEMITIDDKKEINYFYEFTFDNKLQRAYAFYDEERLEIFDRAKELSSLLKDFEFKKNNQQIVS